MPQCGIEAPSGAGDVEVKVVQCESEPEGRVRAGWQSRLIVQAKKKGAYARTPNPNRETKIRFDHRHAVPTDQHVAILPMPPARMLT